MAPSPAHPDSVTGGVREYTDFDHLAEEVRGFGLDWIQLDRGPLRAAVRQVPVDRGLISRFRFNRAFHQRGHVPHGVRTFAVIGLGSPDVAWGGGSSSPLHLVAFPDEDDFEFVSQPGFHGDTVSVTEEQLRRIGSQLGFSDVPERFGSGQGFLRTSRPAMERLRRALTAFHRTAGSDNVADAGDHVLVAMAMAVADGHDLVADTGARSARRMVLHRAIDFIMAHAAEPPTIRQVCEATGASWRMLDYAFREHLGVTPKRYLQAARLRGVRKELIAAEPGVTVREIAAGWGFWHMGQFAADYRRQFGELPSATLRRG